MPSSTATIDAGRPFDWGRMSHDYAVYRPGPPDSYYDMLATLGVGRAGQRILDLGTGTGVLAREFARRGAKVCGIDISPQQIAAAQALAAGENLQVDFRIGSAEEVPHPDGSFEAVTANQCWHYLDQERAVAEARRSLVKNGVLVVSDFAWLPRRDAIARASEALVLKHNPHWSSADWNGRVSASPEWARDRFHVCAMFCCDVPIPFTRDSWRGRMRACRGVGAALDGEQVRAFDEEHAALLEEIAGEEFSVLHRIAAYIFEFKNEPQ